MNCFLGHRQVKESWEGPTKKALAIRRFRACHSAHRRLPVGAVAGWQCWRPAVFSLLLAVNLESRLLASPTQRLQRRMQRKKCCPERAYFHS